MRLRPNRLGLFRIRDGPGSLSTVAKEIVLWTSDDATDALSSQSLTFAFFDARSPPGEGSGDAYLPDAALTVVDEMAFVFGRRLLGV